MIEIAEELSPKKSFVWAVDWPGWCRSGRTVEEARKNLVAARSRYVDVARRAGRRLPAVKVDELETVASVVGGGGTAFGVPSMIVDSDRRSVSTKEAQRLTGLVEAAWIIFDEVAANAPTELRKGPRGGGRDTAKMIEHVVEADSAYAREIGIKHKTPAPDDVAAVAVMRESMTEVLRQPSDGSPIAGRKWTLRYAARRIAWHALDHAWEIEDRTER